MNTSHENNNTIPDWIWKMLPVKTESHFFKSSFGKIHYLRRGSCQQVVMLHGNPTWSFLWRKVMKELPIENYEIIAPDLLNLGFSDNLKKTNFNLQNHVDAMAEFLGLMLSREQF